MEREEIKLGNEDRSTILEDVIMGAFDAGWKDFVRSNRQANSKSNRRLFRLLRKIKSDTFAHSLNQLSKIAGGLPQIRISREPKGMRLKDNRYSAIPEIWVDQKQGSIYGPNTVTGNIYVQVKENRWVYFHFTTH